MGVSWLFVLKASCIIRPGFPSMKELTIDKKTLLEEEALIVRHSGEIPEVAMHSSLYYLTEDPEGPGIVLADEDLEQLKEAVVERYREIILRDLTPENRDKGLYRGLTRCVANWQRMDKFCHREKNDMEYIRAETAVALKEFIQQELADVKSGKRTSCVNCSVADFEYLLGELHLSPDTLPPDWQFLCQGK